VRDNRSTAQSGFILQTYQAEIKQAINQGLPGFA